MHVKEDTSYSIELNLTVISSYCRLTAFGKVIIKAEIEPTVGTAQVCELIQSPKGNNTYGKSRSD
jgi:hypothetical protein